MTIIVPQFLQNKYEVRKTKSLRVSSLYVGLCVGGVNGVDYCSVYNTPHFQFAKAAVVDGNENSTKHYKNYREYAANYKAACTEVEFDQLVRSIVKNGYDSNRFPILVWRYWRNFYFWSVADGFHRLAILAALGELKVVCGVLCKKKSCR